MTFTPKEGYKWEDGTTEARRSTGRLAGRMLATPAQSGSLTYTGAAQSPQWANYDSSKVTLGGTTSGTNGGQLQCHVHPRKPTTSSATGRRRENGGVEDWESGGQPDAEQEQPHTERRHQDRDGHGHPQRRRRDSASSSDANVATASVNGTTITITGKNSGTATITVSARRGRTTRPRRTRRSA